MTAQKHHAEHEGKNRLYEKLLREMGPVVKRGLEDPSVIEIILNPDGHIWYDRMGEGMTDTGETMNYRQALALLGTMAAALDTAINKENPILEGELSIDGSRIEGIIPPVTESPVFAIRKRVSKQVYLNEYVEEGRMTEQEAILIKESVKNRKNILIAGATGSGKTTFANAVLKEIENVGHNVRVLILEDTVELQCGMVNKTQIRTTATVTMRDLLRATMRLRPDRIVVGEVRGGEALDLLKSWNTGHPGGLATVHCDDAKAALLRLEQLVSEVVSTPQYQVIAQAVDIVVFLQRMEALGPMVTEIIEVNGHKGGEYQIRDLTKESVDEKYSLMYEKYLKKKECNALKETVLEKF